MGKLLKYELKGTYKFILGTLIFMALVTIALFTRIDVWHAESLGGSMTMITFGTFIVLLLYIINCFKKELYEERGYLTFTLPLSGNSIIGAKLIGAIIWFYLSGLVLTFFWFLLIKYGFDLDFSVINWHRFDFYDFMNIIMAIIFSTMQIISFMLTVYFSIAISKMAFKKKKLSGFISFIIFIALNCLLGYISFKIADIFPYYINLGNHIEAYGGIISSSSDIGGIMVNPDGSSINIIQFIFFVLWIIGLFLGTGYIIDNRIDL
jgi:magnesium-transporting ATPase (P-type)